MMTVELTHEPTLTKKVKQDIADYVGCDWEPIDSRTTNFICEEPYTVDDLTDTLEALGYTEDDWRLI